MKKISVLLSVFLVYLISLNAQEAPAFSVEVSSDSILMGNMLKVVFTLENAPGNDFQAPYFQEFEVVSGPSVSSSFSMINGKSSQKIAYTYYVQAREVGNYFIEPASIAADESILETLPVEVIVLPNPDGIIQNPDQQTADPFDLRMDDFGWPEFPSFDFEPGPPRQKKQQKAKRKTYKM